MVDKPITFTMSRNISIGLIIGLVAQLVGVIRFFAKLDNRIGNIEGRKNQGARFTVQDGAILENRIESLEKRFTEGFAQIKEDIKEIKNDIKELVRK